MERGKKNTARNIVYGSFDTIAEKTKKKPEEVFEAALENAGPVLEVRSRRIGGANYQVPHEVKPERRIALAMRWLINEAKSKKGSTMRSRLAEELISASKNEGGAVRRRENIQKMADANRAFAHFAWVSRKKKKIF